jgi:hypothetical protein
MTNLDLSDIEGFETAVSNLRPELARPVTWLVPEHERHFDGSILLTGFAATLLTAFLASFAEAFVKQLGAALGKWLASQLARLIAGDGEDEAGDQEATAVNKVARLAPTLHEKGDARAKALDDAEKLIAVELGRHMPTERALAVALSVRQQAEANILGTSG